jgi:hypothetical protein
MIFDEQVKLATILISVSALVISFLGWRNSRVSVRQTIKNSYMTALFEIDKQLMNNPELWTIYENFPAGLEKSTDGKAVGQRRAFIFYHFNLFEVTHTNYTRILYKNKADKEFWASMEKYIKQFFHDSSEARAIFKDPSSRQVYLPGFIEMIDRIINEIDAQSAS